MKLSPIVAELKVVQPSTTLRLPVTTDWPMPSPTIMTYFLFLGTTTFSWYTPAGTRTTK
uniref:Uncharacterized protein n=1 Tax=Zea mays TaxID=4577 RepID=A0A804N2U2_MAIZE